MRHGHNSTVFRVLFPKISTGQKKLHRLVGTVGTFLQLWASHCTDGRMCSKNNCISYLHSDFLNARDSSWEVQRKRPLDLLSCFLFLGPVPFFFLFLGPVQFFLLLFLKGGKTTLILTRVTLLYIDEVSSSWTSAFWYVHFNFDLTFPRLAGLDVYAEAAVGV